MKAFYDVFWHGFVKKNTETAKNSTIHFQLMQQNGTGSLFLCNEKKEIIFSSQLKNYGLCSIEKN